jgi:hypothetical protein
MGDPKGVPTVERILRVSEDGCGLNDEVTHDGSLMPTRPVTVWTCSTCPAESAQRLNHYELTGPGGTRVYDLCDDCRESNPTFLAFPGLGERRTGGRASRSAKRASPPTAPVVTTAGTTGGQSAYVSPVAGVEDLDG